MVDSEFQTIFKAMSNAIYTASFHIRHAKAAYDDGHFIVEAFDSTLPYLASIGSEEMWGLTPFSERDGFVNESLESVEQSENYALTRSGDAICILIAEIQLPEAPSLGQGDPLRWRFDESGQGMLQVGTATVREGWLPSYITAQAHLGLETLEKGEDRDFLYLEVIILDHRTGSLCKGAGAAMIQSIIKSGRENGKTALYVDAVSDSEQVSKFCSVFTCLVMFLFHFCVKLVLAKLRVCSKLLHKTNCVDISKQEAFRGISGNTFFTVLNFFRSHLIPFMRSTYVIHWECFGSFPYTC